MRASLPKSGSHRINVVALVLVLFLVGQLTFVWTLYTHNAQRQQPIDERQGSARLQSNTSSLCPTQSPCPSCPQAVEVAGVTPPLYSLTIIVFTYNRLNGLTTLMNSLLKSDYLNRVDITLRVFLDFPKKADVKLDGTREYLEGFNWPHGSYHLHRRLTNQGLKKSIMESWFPVKDNEFAAFFEDDIEVSPVWFKWTDAALRQYYFPSSNPAKAPLDEKLLGLSLFRPIRDELSGRDVTKPTINGEPYLLQQPCSWGAVYFPRPWRAFRKWYDNSAKISPRLRDDNDPSIDPSSNTWDSGSSWKKYLIKLMYTEGWAMVYSNFPDRAVLSTNHLLPGVHPTPPKKLFELPLVPTEGEMSVEMKRSLTSFPPLTTLRAYNVMYKEVEGIAQLPNYRR